MVINEKCALVFEPIRMVLAEIVTNKESIYTMETFTL